MKRILWLLAFLAFAAPVQAADNVQVTPGTGGKYMACLDISTFCYSKIIIYDTSGAALFASGNGGYVRFPSAQAVTATLGAETTKVIGTVNQGTSPWVISGAVTGTFWQTTQPVSGTFWQTTQPVSLASLPAYAATPTFNCGTGCGAGGSTSNASSGVATSSTNGPTVSYNYGFNGTSWDQLQVDTNKYLKIDCVTGCAGGSGGTSAVDEAAFTWGSPTTYTPIGGVFQTTATSNALSNGQAGAWQMTANRAGFVNMRSASGTEEGTSSNPLYIDTPAGGNLFGAVTSAIPSQSPTVGIGGVGILDGVTPTIVATVKAASTLPAATDKSVVVGLNPGSSVAGTPTGAIVTVQGVGSMTPFAVSRDTTANGATHGLYSNLLQGDTVLSATNGSFANILQGNAALSATNGLYANLMVGNAAVATGTGAQGSTVPRLTVATDTATIAGSAPGTVGSPSANIVSVQTPAGDPCQTQAQLDIPFSVATATTQNILTGTSAKKIYVCYLYMQTGLANNVAVISGTTGGTCGANTAALVGGTTAATGLINAANSGQAFGNGGSSVFHVKTNNDDICIIASAAGPLAGVIKYVVQ
jgi:hypothetical protein